MEKKDSPAFTMLQEAGYKVEKLDEGKDNVLLKQTINYVDNIINNIKKSSTLSKQLKSDLGTDSSLLTIRKLMDSAAIILDNIKSDINKD